MNFIAARPDLPYPGLRPFGPGEAALFFGRDACVDEMIARLRASRFLAVIGTSGSGKSSLVRTGLVHDLTTGGMKEAQPGWKIAECRPGRTPFERLAEALLAPKPSAAATARDPQAAPQAAPQAVHDLADRLRYAPGSLTKWCAEGHLPAYTNLLVIIDQFEELFRYQNMSGQEETEAFVARLIESAHASERPIYVVITMRSEFLGSCALIPKLAEEINAGLYLVRRMTRDEMRQAIVGPAAFCGFAIEPNLVTRLLNDLVRFAPWEGEGAIDRLQSLARRADQLPLMQHVLNRLWSQAKPGPDGEITLRDEDYSRLIDLGSALSAHADEVLNSVSEYGRVAETIFRALVDGPSIATAVRRPCTFSALTALAGGDGPAVIAAVTAVIDAFRHSGCNFLTPAAGTKLDGGTMIDISHESLIRQWKTLAGWTLKEAAAGKYYEDLLERAGDWHQAKQDDLLLRDDRLRSIQTWWRDDQPTALWAERYGGDFALVEHFLNESAKRQNAREAAAAKKLRNRKFRKYLVPAAAFMLLAGLLYVVHRLYDYERNQKAEAYLNKAYAFEHVNDDQHAIAAFHVAVDYGSAEAESQLGLVYFNGNGVAEDDKVALFWLEKGWADGGNPTDAYVAGLILLYSETVKPDPIQAKAWFEKAISAHGAYQAAAEFQMGGLYLVGHGPIKRDYNQAYKWILRAAQDGSADGASQLAYDYFYGTGVKEDYGQALKWAQTAVKNGTSQMAITQIMIGIIDLGTGNSQKPNIKDARASFALALSVAQADLANYPGDEPAMVNLAVSLFLNGRPQDALNQLAQAAKLAPKDPIVAIDQAVNFLMLGQTDQARAIFLNPNDVTIQDIGNDRSWKDSVLYNFDVLQRLGYPLTPESRSLIAEITKDFGS